MSNKHYVFFTYTNRGVGGCQLYMLAKAHYLVMHGWEVEVVYSQGGELYLKEFNRYRCFREENLIKPSFYYFQFKRDLLIKKIIKFLGTLNGEIVFESHSSNMACWAEMVASEMGSVRHIAYEISETLRPPVQMYQYYRFKYNRHELYGILDKSIEFFLKKTNIALDYGCPKLAAYGSSDCVSDVPSPIPTSKMNGYVIGIVGRLEKEYMLVFARNVKMFSDSHSEEHFSVVIVGGAPEGNNTRTRIEQLFESSENVELFFTGYIFPIPRELVEHLDLCLAGSGSASAISREGVTTVSIDPRDNMANGVMGITTKNSVFSEGDKKSVLWWMEEIHNRPNVYKLAKTEYEYDFDSHLNCLNKCQQDFEYNTSYNKGTFSPKLFVKQIINTFTPIWLREKISAVFNKKTM